MKACCHTFPTRTTEADEKEKAYSNISGKIEGILNWILRLNALFRLEVVDTNECLASTW